MLFRPGLIILFPLALLLLPLSGNCAAHELSIPGDSIGKFVQLSGGRVFLGTDTVRLNGVRLERGSDYILDVAAGRLFITEQNLIASDTLTVSYSTIPQWLKSWYGRNIPEPGPRVRSPIYEPPEAVPYRASGVSRRVSVSGTQGVRFSTRSAGTSEFSQSLNLTLSGELADDVEISGVVADRGFDPAYGTLNSRVSELDRINLLLRSPRVNAQLGDIEISGLANQRRVKTVSGVSGTVRFPTWHVLGAAARPRGRFETVQFSGRDGDQGPYRVAGAVAGEPVVPGSEKVWLDGRLLQRGGDKDYIMNYPTGRITFTATHPIDARSRIEIDFEPLLSDYDGELFAAGAGLNRADSALFFSVGIVREGDDSERPERGQFSNEQLDLLRAAGDSIPFVTGVRPDTAGAYILVADSLPDSVYQYVGSGNGDFAVTFTFLGPGRGSYSFAGGDVYRYEGPSGGEYEPVIRLTPPQRTDHFQAVAGFKSESAGALEIDLRQAVTDRNLFSDLDDHDNDAGLLDITYNRGVPSADRSGRIEARYRVMDADFVTRQRLDLADFERLLYFPIGFTASEKQKLLQGGTRFSPVASWGVTGSLWHVDYRDRFDAVYGSLGLEYTSRNLGNVRVSYARTDARLNDTGITGDGLVDNVTGSVGLRLKQDWRLNLRYEHDNRKNTYTVSARGTRYHEAAVSLGNATETVRWEFRDEDTLTSGWSNALNRNRLLLTSARELGRLSYHGSLSYQWLSLPASDQNSLLARLNYQYSNRPGRNSLSGSWTISEEVRNARGVTYLEVAPGEGDFIIEDSAFVPDPDGNFIQVEEILSDASRVRRSEKTFFYSRTIGPLSIRLSSDIEEELLPDGDRNALWILPFYSDDDLPYQFFKRRYSSQLRAFPTRGYHVVNISYDDNLEQRRILDSDPRRRDRGGDLVLKQAVKQTFLEESLGLFSFKRDSYFTGAGEVDGFRAGLTVRQRFAQGEISVGGSLRRADDTDDNRSRLYALTLGGRWQVVTRGEMRGNLELYRQELTQVSTVVPFQLVDSRPGKSGARWNLSFNYGLKQSVRVNFTVTGRHSDERTARIFARGEVLAGF
jgi:hypothetical protein